MRTRSNFILPLILLIPLICGCGKRDNSDSIYRDVSSEGFAYTDSLVYPLELADSVVQGTLTIAIDHGSDYKYANLWLELTYLEGSGLSRHERKDSLMITLSDSSGNWTGTGIASNYQIESEPIEVNFNTSRPVTLRHIMAIDTIKTINRIGVFFLPENPVDSI